MAVRRMLLELVQDPQPRGTIVVERASAPAPAPAPAAWNPESLSPPLSPSSSLPPAAEPESPPRRQGLLPELCAVFHCRGCWTVLGDSLQLCLPGAPQHGFLVCFKVSSDVIWDDYLFLGLEAPLQGCAYNSLSCRSCGLDVGFILYSANSDLASLRGLFCFFEDKILCYLLETQMVVEASKVDFPAVTIQEQLKEMKDKLMELHCRVDLLAKMTEEVKENKCVTQWQRSASETDGLLSECA
ncbi:protein Mis18-beta [Pithys albifrons albifrons]|uniref:protein Mis18-beta n=1 Tax=Pithys albifrons albifrons TaxID=3385563 RepID=UPI003A5D213A